MKKHAITAVSIATLVILSACSSVTMLVRHPRTGDVKECRGDVKEWVPANVAKNCVKQYEKLGYELVK